MFRRALNKKFFRLLILMSIGFVLLYLAVWVFTAKERCIDTILEKDNIVPALIIGAGPAGLSCALYTARAKIPTVVLVGPQPGGQLAQVRQIENWPAKRPSSGKEVVDELRRQVKHFGAWFLQDTVKSIDMHTWPFKVETETGKILHALTLIIATGRIAKRLDIPGVDTYWGHGVGVCTICDAPFHKNEEVGVVGGGDTAVDHALQLAAYAKKVYMFVREDKLDATQTACGYVRDHKKIVIMYNTQVKEIKGDGEKIQTLVVESSESGKQSTISAQGLYFAIGWHPNSQLVKSFLKTNDNGFIRVKSYTQETNVSGVFAAGDVTDAIYGKAGIASGSGIKAGMDTIDYLQDLGIDYETIEKYKKRLYKPAHYEIAQNIRKISSSDQLQSFLKEHKSDLVILDFYNPMCPSCKALIPVLQDLQQSHVPPVYVAKINIDKAPDLAEEYNVTSIPYLVVYKKNKITAQTGSVRKKNEIINLLKN